MLQKTYTKISVVSSQDKPTVVYFDRRMQCECGEHKVSVHKIHNDISTASLMRLDNLFDYGKIKPHHMFFNSRTVCEVINFHKE